jgi:hypothetical protein
MNKKKYLKPILNEHGDLKSITKAEGPGSNDSTGKGGHDVS